MASFDLTAQLQLQAPTNTNAVIGQIKNQLKGLNVPVNVQANTQAIKQTTQAINNVSKSSKDASKSVDKLGNSIKYAARRFGAFAIGTQILGSISSGFARVTKEALQFEVELNKIQQITGQTRRQVAGLQKTVTDLSKALGTSSNDLINVAKTLNQAGFAARDVEQSLRVLAQTTLGSSFNNIAETTEGAIAVLRQFSNEAKSVGSDAKFLEKSLDSINAVSKQFAVESGDIIQAIRRIGGVFSTAGGSVNELIALFTSIRATTRESAETISVGLRTIFTRLQRNDTVQQLERLGVQLRTAEGQFVGPLKAVEALSTALNQLDPRDFRFSQIVEELGGIRQVGKVIPLIKEYSTAQAALAVANRSAGSVANDAALAQQTLANQFAKTGEAFSDLARKFTQSQGFQDFASQMLKIAQAVAKVAESLIPLIPLVTQLGAAFAGIKLAGFVTKGVGSILGKNSGGKIHKFARGGFVPGTGNSDTVPAMLMPGEFVIKKSSAQKLGADTLNRMNNNRYKKGGEEDGKNTITPGQPFTRTLKRINLAAVLAEAGDKDPSDKELDIGGAFLQPGNVVPKYVAKISEGRQNVYEEIKKGLGSTVRGKSTITDKQIDDAIGYKLKNFSIGIESGSLTAQESDNFQTGLKNSISSFANSFGQTVPGTAFNQSKFNSAYQKANIEQVEGNIFEAFVNGLSSAPFDNTKIRSNDTFDFSAGLGANNKFGIAGNIPTDAKRTFDKSSLGSLANKGATYLIDGFRSALAQSLKPISGDIGEQRKLTALGTARKSTRAQERHFGGIIQKFAEGGEAASDKQVSFINSLLEQFQRDIGQRHPATDEWEAPESKAAASSIITKLKAAQTEKALLKEFLGRGVIYGYGRRNGSGFVVNKSGPGRVQQRPLSEFGGDKKKIQEYIERGELAFGSMAPSSRGPSANSATSRLKTRYGYGGRRRFATGGSAGTDTVPALLTPGEYVINKSAAQSIGYANLNSMNETGVARFATGGAVGVQKFANGGAADNPFANMGGRMGASAKKSADVAKALKQVKDAADDNTKAVGKNTKAVDDSSSSIGDFGSELSKASPALNKASEKITKFAFVGVAFATTAIQTYGKSILGLTDDQAAAATEAAAFGGIIAAAGSTLISWIASTAASILSKNADTTATAAHTAAVTADTATTAASAASMNTFSIGITAAVLSVAVVSSVFKYMAVAARQVTDRQIKATTELVEKFRETGRGLEAYVEQIRRQGQAQVTESAANVGVTGAVAGGSAFAAIGMAIGTAILPGVGTLIGGVLGGIAGAIAGGIGGLTGATAIFEAELARLQPTINAWANVTKEAIQAQRDFTTGLEEIEKNILDQLPQNASEEQRRQAEEQILTRQTDSVIAAANSSGVSAENVNQALRNLERVSSNLNIPVSQLTEENIRAGTEGIMPSLTPAQANLAIANLRAAQESEAAIRESIKATAGLLSRAADDAFKGGVGFDQAIQGDGNFAKLYKQQQSNILNEANATLARLYSQRRDAQDIGDEDATARINQQIEDTKTQAREDKKNLEQTFRTRAENVAKLEEAQRIQDAYNAALEQSIIKYEALNSAIVTVSNSLLQIEASAKNFVAAITTGNINFESKLPDNFGDITNTGNRTQFDRTIDQTLKPFGNTGRELSAQIKSGADIFEAAKTELRGTKFELNQTINPQEILDRIGLDPAVVGPAVLAQIGQNLNTAAEKGEFLSEDKIAEIFAPALEEGKKAAEIAKQLNELRNREFAIYQDYVKEIEAQFAKETTARQNVVKTMADNADILARGGVIQEVSRQQKQAFRSSIADIGLRGTGLRSGDIGGAKKLVERGIEERRAIAERQRLGQATLDDVKALGKFNRQIGQATAELERLADQSDRVADIQADIEKERAKRGAIEGVAEDFVFGGQSSRQSINEGLAGVQAALQTGTVQNQSEQQRQATLQTLNKLSSIPFFKQLKENLIQSDAARLGIDPRIAQALFNPTGEEQRLQQELIAVTQQRTNASIALAELEAQKTQAIISKEDELIKALGELRDAIANRAPGQADQQLVGRAGGGIVRGPGSGRSDSILAKISDGEYVINAKATRENFGLLEDINQGKKILGFANGGGYNKDEPSLAVDLSSGTATYQGGTNQTANFRDYQGDNERMQQISGRRGYSNQGQMKDAEFRSNFGDPEPLTLGEQRTLSAQARGARQGLANDRFYGPKYQQMLRENSAATGGTDELGFSRGDRNYYRATAMSGSINNSTRDRMNYNAILENNKKNRQEYRDNRTYGELAGLKGEDRRVAYRDIQARRRSGEAIARPTGNSQYDMMMQSRANNYNTGMQARRDMFGGGTTKQRSQYTPEQQSQQNMNRGQLGMMQAQQMQNKYNARAANFNSSIAQSQMAFRMQAAQFVGAGALQGFAGQFMTGSGARGGGYGAGLVAGGSNVGAAGGGGFGGQITPQQTNNMNVAANGGNSIQSMDGITINHNVTVNGMIAIGGLNIQAVASAVTQSVGQMVVQEVTRQINARGQGFTAGT